MLNYTSGTTGDSKGVKVTHWGILSSAWLGIDLIQMTEADTYISYLPAPHVFENFIYVTTLMTGAKVGFFQGDPLKLVEDCGVLQPTLFPSVPRLYNKIYQRIDGQFKAFTGCKKWLVDKGLQSKLDALRANASYSSACYDSLVFSKVTAMLGGKVRLMITASAPISGEVLEFLKAVFCCPILEAYGMSETCGATTITKAEDPVCGHVGGPVKTCAIRLKDLPDMEYLSTDKPYPRGEICMRGSMIFKGYFLRPDKTAEAIQDGWLLSGDVGQVYPNGTIKIIDRSKNIFKLSQGEYLAPEKLENAYIQSPLVTQIMIYGDSFKNCAVAIVVPDEASLATWAKANGKEPADVYENQDEYCKVVLDSINEVAKAKKFNSLEKPKEIYLTKEAFSVENDILTPTFKMKRNVGKKIYQDQNDKMYEKLAARGQ